MSEKTPYSNFKTIFKETGFTKVNIDIMEIKDISIKYEIFKQNKSNGCNKKYYLLFLFLLFLFGLFGIKEMRCRYLF